MCGSMVDIQRVMAENMRGKKERRNDRGKIECPHLLCRVAIVTASIMHCNELQNECNGEVFGTVQ